MKRLALFIMLSACASAAVAEQLLNVDDNTLWIENGINIKFSPKGGWHRDWRGGTESDKSKKQLKIQSAPDGKGFDFIAATSGGDTFTVIPHRPEYPYLICDIAGIEVLENGYTHWGVYASEPQTVCGQAGSPTTGTYIINLFENPARPYKPGNYPVTFYNYRLRLHFNYIKVVKKPDCLIQAESDAFTAKKAFSVGDKLKFTVSLAQPAEDVSLQIVTTDVPKLLKINGVQKIQLKPADDSQKVWKAELTVRQFAVPQKMMNKRNRLFLKAVILGGGYERPVFTTIGYPFVSESSPAAGPAK